MVTRLPTSIFRPILHIGLLQAWKRYWRRLGLVAGLLIGNALAGATLDWGDGVNVQPSYYNGGEVNLGWELMAQHKAIKTVRIEIEPSVSLATVKRWLKEAQSQGYTVIATYHHYPSNGSDSVGELLKAAQWWRQNYASLREEGPLIVNLMNEWGSHQQTVATYAAAYNEAVAIVRSVYAGPLIVDLPGWGQETYVARDASPLLTDKNLVFSVHIYSGAYVQQGAGRWMKPKDLDALAECGRPILVGEFGASHKGGADWSALVDHARSKGWTLLAWAWTGDGEKMKMVQPAWVAKPSADNFSISPYFAEVYKKLRPSLIAK